MALVVGLALGIAGCSTPSVRTVASAGSSSAGVSASEPTAPSSVTPLRGGAMSGKLVTVGQAAAAQAVSAQASLAGKVITIDPGHDGGNASHPREANRLVNIVTGTKPCDAVGTQTVSGYSEHAFTWDLANRTAAVLRARGATVVLTRPNDTGWGPCNIDRAAIGNRAHSDAAISLHADGGPTSGRGFHVIAPGAVRGNEAIVAPSRTLAYRVRSSYKAGTGMPYATYLGGGQALTVRTDLGGLNLSRVPKVFIECGNMRNATDAALLRSPAWRNRAAQAIADGLTSYLTAP